MFVLSYFGLESVIRHANYEFVSLKSLPLSYFIIRLGLDQANSFYN